MWFIFPQIKGIGFSDTSKYYAIRDLDEAKDFLRHPILGHNFVSICSELLKLQTNNPTEVFGKPDDQKLFSSMTLFSLAAEETSTFHKVLDKYFNGEKDQKTIALLNSE